MTSVFDLSDRYVDDHAALDPVGATFRGVSGHDGEMTDYSPDGLAARAELDRSALAAVSAAAEEGEGDRLAKAVLAERLGVALDLHDADENLRPLRIIGSPVQSIRQVFDVMAKETEEDWATVATRMAGVPEAVAGLETSLRLGLDRSVLAARRQALACADQAATWSGRSGAAPYFATVVGAYSGDDAALRRDLDSAASAASAAYAGLAAFLRDTYAPAALERDAVGPERYAVWARASNGADLDLRETYSWGWAELHRIEADMAVEAERILPGGGLDATIELLETDPARSIEGAENFRSWLQDLMDRTIDELDGVHFDIAEPIKRVEAMIAPPGGAAAMYYTGPSEDFSRPGRTWYPTLGKTRFPTWGEVSIAYHEGVPGHHLQVAQVRYLADRLSRFQRMSFVSGHGEGWALYAERLMDDLGYLDTPETRLGMLRAQAMRAVRVVVDLGMHLELTIPDDDPFSPGATWTPELGQELLFQRSRFPRDFMASEVVRYLGWPGQAISYKVGERVWLAARDEVRAREGVDFDQKAFHARALALGPLGLDLLRVELVGS